MLRVLCFLFLICLCSSHSSWPPAPKRYLPALQLASVGLQARGTPGQASGYAFWSQSCLLLDFITMSRV